MPTLPDQFQDPPVANALHSGMAPNGKPIARPNHPSPSRDGLALEVFSDKELGYHDQIFGVDTPYWYEPAGWGEWLPLIDS